MTTEDISLACSAVEKLLSAMSKLVLDTDLADFTVTCGEKEWKVHSSVLAVRSPFFKAAITNNMAEKLQMKIEIKDFDPETMEEVINYMYGKLIEKAPAKFLFEAAERFLMNDLKKDVIKLAKKRMNLENVIELGHLAEHYSIESFLGECAEFIVKNNVEMKEEDLSSKLTVRVLRIYKEKSKTGIQKVKKSKANDCNEGRSEDASYVKMSRGGAVSYQVPVRSTDDSLVTLWSKLTRDCDLHGLTLTFGDKCVKYHSIILAMRSPFFKAAITNIMTNKLEMKIEIKDLDPETVKEVLNFMYGFSIKKSPIKFLLKAAERFRMDDLRVDVVKLAKKRMTVENVVEFGLLAEMYNIGHFIRDCAEFIVKNDVEMKEQDMSPKLATLVLSNLKDANRKLKDDKRKLNEANDNVLQELKTSKKKLEASENANRNLKDDKRKLNEANDNVLQELDASKKKLEASEIELQNYKNKSLWDKVWKKETG